MSQTPLCPDCHEPAEPHDMKRCKTITRAFCLENAKMGDEVSYQIVSLVTWLEARPNPRTSRGVLARDARKEFLDHYIKIAQK